jgi:hypothetical protein
MPKKYSLKFWIAFWSMSVILLAGFYLFLQFKKQPAETLNSAIDYLPFNLEKKQEFKSIAYFANYLLKKDDQEKTFMILFQNNMELRPGGGYIGSFGILKTKNGKVEELQTHDLSNFDGRIPSTIEPPYPMKETLRIDSWKLRDSNWSPDFSENAKKADYFYHLGQGQEEFNGIVAINTNVLTSFLKVTGPISLPDYPGTYSDENAILALEYQVEKGYAEQGIEKGDRKSVMNELASAIMDRVSNLSNSQKFDLAKIILNDLNKKDIQLYFKNDDLEAEAQKAGWSGIVNGNWKKDYLYILDANLGAFKSDYYIERSFNYKIDLSSGTPKANLKITYNHTGKVKDWMTRDYLTYLRVYVPQGSWLDSSNGLGEIKYGDELGKKYFGSLVKVPLNETRTVEFSYNLPENLNLASYYNLMIQKQSGASDVPGHIFVIDKNGEEKNYNITLTGDWVLNK